ncbi:uncharacterized protein AKAW2_60956S [Aspergillus luchuensis]|uniref:Uncharacterized protein n=1 Tax=Aspergillus kawachii TaxID=1069201 RepID=A0A7R7WGQ9_ASPKA|nr:uncharacterized protein AKAW2_60956S [Aspergillus luchuensis]BCS02692.1 hypothetical protein AKAW2_60956S [Aspergillus luchuensis]
MIMCKDHVHSLVLDSTPIKSTHHHITKTTHPPSIAYTPVTSIQSSHNMISLSNPPHSENPASQVQVQKLEYCTNSILRHLAKILVPSGQAVPRIVDARSQALAWE